VSIEDFAKKMFKAGSNLSSKTPEEIFYQDFKKFIFGESVFGVGQISSMSRESLQEIKERMLPIMKAECGKNGITMVFFMLTDIMTEETELLYYGKDTEALIMDAFHIKAKDGECILPGVVSRKKQLIPAFMESLQNV
jgi:manganese-dependent inorganic pyrophosphatase